MHANICVQILALQPVVCKSLHATICMQPLCANACMPTMVCKSSHATHGVQTFACKPLRASPAAPERRQAGSLHSLPTPSLLSEPQSRVTHPWKPPAPHPVHPSARRARQRGPAALPGHAAGGVLGVTVTPPAGTSPLFPQKIKGKDHRDQTRPGAWAQGSRGTAVVLLLAAHRRTPPYRRRRSPRSPSPACQPRWLRLSAPTTPAA